MSELSIQLKWQLGEGELVQGKYSNSHEITYNDQFKLTADAAPDWGGDIANTNPEPVSYTHLTLPTILLV